jgi:hypothetical protein
MSTNSKKSRRVSNKLLTDAPQAFRKNKTKPQCNKQKEIVRIGAEMNEMETKKNTKNQ